jgi:hypothetical protein
MKRVITALAAFAVALPAMRALADDDPRPPPASSGAESSTTQGPAVSTSTTVVIAAPIVATGHFLPDLFINLFALGAEISAIHAIEEHHQAATPPVERDEPLNQYAPRYRDASYRRKHDAREGFLFSFGVGGGEMRLSGVPATGAVDLGLRMGYGFSDRFQLFGDLTADVGQFQDNQDATSWLLSMRGQTVLIGDRDGNGLNLNLGVGLGGLSIRYRGFADETSSPAGLALVSGLSYDARVGQQFALSPELYFNWHVVPNGPGFASDHIYTAGIRLNFLWYAP